MKTVKFALVAAIVACTMVGMARADGWEPNPQLMRAKNISLNDALHTPGLVAAMYAQIDKNEILNCPGQVYIATVKVGSTVYRINGTVDAWVKFFLRQGVNPVKLRKGPSVL